MSTNYPTIAISDEALISSTPLQHVTVHFYSQLQVVLAILRPPFVSSLLQISSSRVGFCLATKELYGTWHLQQQTLRRRPSRCGLSPSPFASALFHCRLAPEPNPFFSSSSIFNLSSSHPPKRNSKPQTLYSPPSKKLASFTSRTSPSSLQPYPASSPIQSDSSSALKSRRRR